MTDEPIEGYTEGQLTAWHSRLLCGFRGGSTKVRPRPAALEGRFTQRVNLHMPSRRPVAVAVTDRLCPRFSACSGTNVARRARPRLADLSLPSRGMRAVEGPFKQISAKMTGQLKPLQVNAVAALLCCTALPAPIPRRLVRLAAIREPYG